MGREGKFEACIPGNHGKREFPLTPGWTPEFGKLCQIFNTLSKKFRLEPDPDYQNPLHYNTQVTGLATCGVVEWMCCSTIKKSESRSVVEWSVMQPGSSVALVALSQYHVGRTAGTKWETPPRLLLPNHRHPLAFFLTIFRWKIKNRNWASDHKSNL